MRGRPERWNLVTHHSAAKQDRLAGGDRRRVRPQEEAFHVAHPEPRHGGIGRAKRRERHHHAAGRA